MLQGIWWSSGEPLPRPFNLTTRWQSRLQFWQFAEVTWSPPDDAVFDQHPAPDGCFCRNLCISDARCVAADLVVTSEGLSCRLAARRGGSPNTTSAVAAFVRVGRADLGERCLTDAECWESLEGAGCVDGVCACPAPALTARRDCVISNCSELTALGVTTSGQHWVRLAAGAALTALYCDMETDGGGWTVFQRRQDDTEQVDFYRDWQDYRDGFGNVSGQFWLGNELIHHLTARGPHQLRIDMEDFEGDRRFAQYASFSLADEADNYRLSSSKLR
ncbi:Ficolin-1 [Amphibalanus amphitrite]|uniref:Ficolin-1 n=1 Tax=Amphibalanus amphitrite TaxID=1232801 RepID=A0A6A4WGN8_AMPAM|nr:Ficolin-1 [Amphibalanus amphitrite]